MKIPRELIYIHFAVFLFGLSGLFANWIGLSAMVIVLGRVFFASIFLAVVLVIKRVSMKMEHKKDIVAFLFIGALLALHWTSFFHAIQLSTVAIGLMTFATFPIFASYLEPLFFREKIKNESILLALLTMVGVWLIIPEINMNSSMTLGALWGLISGASFAVLSILNRKYVASYHSLKIGFYQNFFAFIWLVPILFFQPIPVKILDISLLILLGTLFTGIAHVMFIGGLKKVSVQKASIMTSLEPVYGIGAAMIIFNQIPSGEEWIGITLIFTLVIYTSVRTMTNMSKSVTTNKSKLFKEN